MSRECQPNKGTISPTRRGKGQWNNRESSERDEGEDLTGLLNVLFVIENAMLYEKEKV